MTKLELKLGPSRKTGKPNDQHSCHQHPLQDTLITILQVRSWTGRSGQEFLPAQEAQVLPPLSLLSGVKWFEWGKSVEAAEFGMFICKSALGPPLWFISQRLGSSIRSWKPSGSYLISSPKKSEVIILPQVTDFMDTCHRVPILFHSLYPVSHSQGEGKVE